MLTEQSYPGGGIHATDSEQSAKTAPQTPLPATNQPVHSSEHVVPVINIQQILNALRDWASQSLGFIQQSNQLNQQEKKQALDQFERHDRQITKNLKVLESIPDESPYLMTACLEEMDIFLRRQVRMNQIARLYEIPVFAEFPIGFMEWHEPIVVTFEVISEEFAEYLKKDDELITTLLPEGQWPDAQSLVVVQYRLDHHIPRSSKIGWFKAVDKAVFTLEYRHERLTKNKPD